MQFRVRAVRGHAVETLKLEAASAEDARRIAGARQLEVLSVEQANTWLIRRGAFNLGLFSQELFELLDAGLSIVEAVDALAAREPEGTEGVYHELLAGLRKGLSFSDAMETMPECFPSLYVGLIRASERTSDLSSALARYLDYSGRLDTLRAKVVSALVYPSILAGVGGLVILFLLVYVVPRFASVYQGSNRPLPMLSALLLDWGAFVSANTAGLSLSAGLGLAAAAAVAIAGWRTGRIEVLLTLMPKVKGRVDLFRMSRLYLTLGTLINGGMPVVQALSLARGVVRNKQASSIDAAIGDLRRGESLTRALERHGMTSPVAVRLLRVGEGTGRIGDLFIRTARYHDNELGRWIERFSKAFEPVLMAVIGIIIGGIVILLYLPIFDLAGSFR